MKGILFFIGSSGLGKLLPLLFGLYIANMAGHESYVLFVQLLVQSNFLTTVATVSSVQFILSSKGSQPNVGSRQYAFRAVIFAVIVSIVGGASAAYVSPNQLLCSGGWFCWSAVIVGFVVALYSFGNSALTIVMAQFNAELRNARAGLLMFFGLLIPYGIGFTLIQIGLNYYLVFLLLALLFTVIALVAYWRCNAQFLLGLNSKETYRLSRLSLPLEKDQIYIMVFVGAILFAHSYAISRVSQENDAAMAAVFALGYQLFAVGLFIPSILGNVVVPRLSRGAVGGAVSISRLAVLYIAISSIWLAFIYLLGESILAWYGLVVNSDNMIILLILQSAVVFGAVNALLNQQFAAKKDFFVMAVLALLYLVVLYLCGMVMGFGADFAATGILISYLITVVIGIILTRVREIVN